MKKRLLAIIMAFVMAMSLLPMSAFAAEDPVTVNGKYTGDVEKTWTQDRNGTYTDTETGITVSKTAKKATSDPNVFDIELKVETSTTTTVQSAQAATVLVIDTSGSMSNCANCGEEENHKNHQSKSETYYCPDGSGKTYEKTSDWNSRCKNCGKSLSNHRKVTVATTPTCVFKSRMDAAKEAAIDFLETYSGENAGAGRYLAIVQFSTSASIAMTWTDVSGGSAAEGYRSAVSTINGLTANGGTNLDAGFHAAYDLMRNTTVAGIAKDQKNVVALTDGQPTYHNNDTGYWGNLKGWADDYDEHSSGGSSTSEDEYNATINGASTLKGTIAGLYTICFGVSDQVFYNNETIGDFLKNKIASSADKAYNANNITDLKKAFKAIANSITEGITGEGAVVTDPMSKYVTLNSTPDGATAENGTITWNLTNPKKTTEGGTTKYVYTLTYQVTLKEDYRDGEYHPTNDVTYLTLPNDDGTINFPVPGVKAEPTRTVSFVGETASRVYNGSEQTLTNFTATGLPAGYTSNVSYAASGTDANTYGGTITAGSDVKILNAAGEDVTKSFKEITTTAGQLTITPRPITITVNSAEKYFDDPDPTFTGSITSGTLVKADDLGTITYYRTNNEEDVGSYPGVLNASYTSNSNYTVTVEKGDFEIKTATAQGVTLTAAGGEWTYDGDAHAATASVSAEGYTIYYKVGDSAWTTIAPSVTNVDDGPVTVQVKATKTGYTDLTCDNVTLKINPRPVTITVNDAEKAFGESDPDFTGSITSELGLVNENDLGTITYNRTNNKEDIGSYPGVLDASYTSNSNYTVTVVKGDFTITTATENGASLTAVGGTWTYDGNAHAATASVSEASGYTIYYKVGEDGEWTTIAPSVTNVDDGTVTVQVKATKTGYTDLTCQNVTLKITPRDVTLTSATDSKVYDGTALTNGTVTVGGDGFVGEEGATYDVSGSQTKIGSSGNAFTYELKSNTKACNYNITKSEGTLTVTPVSGITITKTPKQTNVTLGDTITWTVTVKNTSEIDAKGLILTDSIEGVTITAPEGINYQNFDLAAGKSIEFTVTYKPEKTGTYVNHVEVSQPKDNPDDENATEKVAEADSDPVKVSDRHTRPSKPPVLNKEDHYAYVVGYPDGTVKPQGNITRAEVATIFFRMLTDESRNEFWSQTNSYSDVSEGQWFNNAISTLANAGILSGYPDGTFRPNAPITRAEFTKIAASFFEQVEYTIDNPFTDVNESDWFYKFVMAAYEDGLITGYPEGDFRPNANINRAEAMTIVNRTLGRAPDADHFLKDMIVWPDNPKSAWYYEAVQEATNSHEYVMKGTGTNQYEEWTKILEVRDWPALEKEWSDANSAAGGEVVK